MENCSFVFKQTVKRLEFEPVNATSLANHNAASWNLTEKHSTW